MLDPRQRRASLNEITTSRGAKSQRSNCRSPTIFESSGLRSKSPQRKKSGHYDQLVIFPREPPETAPVSEACPRAC